MSIDIYATQHAFSSSGWASIVASRPWTPSTRICSDMRCRFSLHNRFLGPQFQSEVRTSAVLIGKRSDAISVISAIAELHCAPPETAVVLSLRGSSKGVGLHLWCRTRRGASGGPYRRARVATGIRRRGDDAAALLGRELSVRFGARSWPKPPPRSVDCSTAAADLR